MQGWWHAKLLEEVFDGIKPWNKVVHKRASGGISKRQMDQILRVDATGRIQVFLESYAKRSSLRTIMGQLYMTLHVWRDKDGATQSFFWSFGQVQCATDTTNKFAGRVRPFEDPILAIFGFKGGKWKGKKVKVLKKQKKKREGIFWLFFYRK